MLEKTPEDYYTLQPFAEIPHLLLAYSTMKFGSMNYRDPRATERRDDFFSLLGEDTQSVFRMEQEHGTSIQEAKIADTRRTFPSTDGLFTKERGVFLTAMTADCIPVTIYDHETKAVGIAHAGWKGTYEGIATKLVQTFLASGSHVRSLLLGLGPSIRSCCYTIDDESAKRWKERYPETWKLFIFQKDGKMHLSLQDAIIQQMQSMGLQREQITDAAYCTKEHEEFYSYRRTRGASPIGEFVTVVGLY